MNPKDIAAAIQLAWSAWRLIREVVDYIEAGDHDAAAVAHDRLLQKAAGEAARRSQKRDAK